MDRENSVLSRETQYWPFKTDNIDDDIINFEADNNDVDNGDDDISRAGLTDYGNSSGEEEDKADEENVTSKAIIEEGATRPGRRFSNLRQRCCRFY